VLFDGIEQALHVEFVSLDVHFFVSAERIPMVPFALEVGHNPFKYFPLYSPLEQHLTQPREKRSGCVSGHILLVVLKVYG
jgi:hypothetical protein